MVAKSRKFSPVPMVLPAESAPTLLPDAAIRLDSLADLGRANLAAMAKANLAWNDGLSAIGDELFAYAKTTLASASQAATALLGAKSMDEVLELNSDLAKTAIETLIERSTKLGELGITAANQTLAPLGGRIEATFASFTRPAS